jgi:hypothetical protein
MLPAARAHLLPRLHVAVAALWVVATLLVANAFAYVGRVSNPLLAYDNWVFVDTFLRVALEQGAGLGDYLVKRAGVDHAQPLGKLVMLLNYRWFGLDFRLEGYLGIAFGVAAFIVMCQLVLRTATADTRVAACAVLIAIAAVFFSIDSLNVYLYSMVTMWHSLTLCFLVVAWLAWRALQHVRWKALAGMALLWGIVADDTAIIGTAALVLAIAVWAWRPRRWHDALRVVLVLGAALLACRGIYAAFGEVRGATQPEFNVDLGARVSALASMWRDAWSWIATPLASGLVHRTTAESLLGHAANPARNAVACLLLVAHIAFWRSAVRRGPENAVGFVAIALMLYFYAHVAGLLYGRVFVRGADFLDQQRYVVFYRLGVVALLLMLAARLPVRSTAATWRASPAWAMAAVAPLLLLQLPVARHEWGNAHAFPGHFTSMASDMAAVARDPVTPRACVHGVDICLLDAGPRAALARFVVAYRVNLFSPAFQRRHPGLARTVADAPGPGARAAPVSGASAKPAASAGPRVP